MRPASLWLTLCLLIFAALHSVAQQSITLDDIWLKGTFQTRSVPGFRFALDGKTYLRQEGNMIQVYDIRSGEKTATFFDGSQVSMPDGQALRFSSYQPSDDESSLLLETGAESIYRYSVRASYWIWNRTEGRLRPLYDAARQMYPRFAPDGKMVAFVSDNDLYVRDLGLDTVRRITRDGEYSRIINGASDWVYEEEFTLKRAYEWSPDGKYIAFIRFDETDVPEFTMDSYTDALYPERVSFKYPKVGEKNAVVSLWIYDLKTGKSTQADIGPLEDRYIPRIQWAGNSGELVAFRMNRHQNELDLLLVDPVSGKSKTLLSERNKYYIDIHDDLTFLPDRSWFIWSSERSGFNHLYLYDMSGKLIRPLTSGNFDVTAFYGADARNQKIYYQAAEASAMERQVFEAGFDGKGKKLLTPLKGWNEAQFSSSFDFFVNTHSTINTAPSYTVHNRAGEIVRLIESNQNVPQTQQKYGVQPVEFFRFSTSEDVALNGYMIKPPGFDPSRKYPVFMYLYGGPNSQQVTDSWKGSNYWWFQMLAQNGYIVVCVDNRGTGGRGEEFRKMTYLQLGHFETIDQIEAALWLGKQPYVDASRIGIYGWSYGGYMSSLCLLKGNHVFKAAIAVAPVTNWKWYDTIYTERYMRTEKENPDGYKNNSPVYFADRLKGKYLLVHGMADDNVHFQNTVEMANALIAANKQFETYFYPNRNHGIYGGYARIHLFTKMTDFIYHSI